MKTLLIVGGSRGIGRELAKLVISDYRVIITGRNIDSIHEACAEIGNNVLYIQYDLLDTVNINRLYEQALEMSHNNKIDYMVYSAAIQDVRPVVKFDYQYNLDLFNINFFSFVELAKLFVKQKFSTDNKGKIITISTMETQVMGGGSSIYTASKSALESFCITMAREYVKRNIIINGLRPTHVQTDMTKHILKVMPELKEIYPFEILSPIDIANIIQWLLSDTANVFTGKFLDVNNGYFVK